MMQPEIGASAPIATRLDASTLPEAPMLPEPRIRPPSDVRTERGRLAQLVINRGPEAGARFAITAGYTAIGRHRECDIVLEDATISRHHAEVYCGENNCCTIVDVGSLNGTYLNRHPVGRADLADGDEIWIGKARFTFQRR